MRKIKSYPFIALLTFIIGVLGVSFWIIKAKSLTEPPMEYPVQLIEKPSAPVQSTEEIELTNIPLFLPNPNNRTDDAKFSKDSDKQSWIPIFFEAIDERAGKASLPKLKKSFLPKDDLEIRVWIGFGITLLEGVIIKRNKGHWSAIYLEGADPELTNRDYQKNRSEYERQLQTPIAGWNESWQRLVDKGILSLPDASEINCNSGDTDGFSFVVEYKINKTYRTYMYDNPNPAKCHEAKQMVEIFKILRDDFIID